MDNVYQAIEHASQIWQQAVFLLSWSHGLIAIAYGLAAWLCFLNVRMTKEAQQSCAMWCAATTLMFLMGTNVVLQGDVFVTQIFRALARLQGWYEYRHDLQYWVICLVALTALVLGYGAFHRFESYAQTYTGAVSTGLLALMILLIVRTVSAHSTDAVINARFVGFSMGRLFELVGIAWVALGALRSLRQPWIKPKSYSLSSGRHV